MRILRFALPLSFLIAFTALAADPPTSQPAPPASILPAGQTQRELQRYLTTLISPFQAPAKTSDWLAQSAQIRARVRDEVLFRGMPRSWREDPVRIEWQGELQGKGYKIRKLRFEAVPGLWCGALLYQPETLSGKVPAILNVNGHVGPPGMSIDYKQARCINQAKRGMLALSLEWIGMGQLHGPGYQHWDLSYLDLAGLSGVGVMYQELARGLDVLLAQPNADRERVAVTGLSGGGWQTILISALDPRVRLSVPNAGYIGIEPRLHFPEDVGDYEQLPPDLCRIADYPILTALLAPRPALLIYNEKDDCCFPAPRARKSVYEPVIPFYELMQARDRFELHVNTDPGTHNYLLDNRKAFYRFVNKHFLPNEKWADEELPIEGEIRTQQELTIQYPDDNATLLTLAEKQMADLSRSKKDDANAAPSMPDLRAQVRKLLCLEEIPQPTATPLAPASQIVDTSLQIQRMTLKLGERWTLPAIVLAPEGEPSMTILMLADKGRNASWPAALAQVKAGKRVVLVDVLFLGECSLNGAKHQFAMMANSLGRRPLGLQIEQLAGALDWLRLNYAGHPLHLHAQGPMASLAGLMLGAMEPRRFDRITLLGLDFQFREMVQRGIKHNDYPTFFTPDLLTRVDVPELVRLAAPTEVILQK